MRNKLWLILGLSIMLAILMTACGVKDKSNSQPSDINNEETNTTDPAEETSGEVKETGETKEFTINASNFKFDPGEIHVKQGDRVKINLINDTGGHGIQIGDLGVKLVGGETTEFSADKKGTFTFACSVQCGAGHDNMTGILIVE